MAFEQLMAEAAAKKDKGDKKDGKKAKKEDAGKKEPEKTTELPHHPGFHSHRKEKDGPS